MTLSGCAVRIPSNNSSVCIFDSLGTTFFRVSGVVAGHPTFQRRPHLLQFRNLADSEPKVFAPIKPRRQVLAVGSNGLRDFTSEGKTCALKKRLGPKCNCPKV